MNPFRGPVLHYDGPTFRVRILARPNRFLVRVRIPQTRHPAFFHLPNPGRMEELIVPGETDADAIWRAGRGRKTPAEVVAIRTGPTRVGVDPRLSNRLVALALQRGWLKNLGQGRWKSEVIVGQHRFDFGRERRGRLTALLEVKSSNLRVGRTALFPDAPTDRGRRQLQALDRYQHRGFATAVVFVVQRNDVSRFTPNRVLDPRFAAAFDSALRAGVRLEAVRIRPQRDRLVWNGGIPVVPRLSGAVF